VSAPAGTVRRWVRPYHQWSYVRDQRPGGHGAELRRVLRAEVRHVGGLVFVWLGGQPDPFDDVRAEIGRALSLQGLERAKVAHQIDYDVKANWKLIWHNNRECWHCHAGHPEYIKANFDSAPDGAPFRRMAQARARDHVVLTRLVPAGPERTLIRLQWLVDRDAVEGRDYRLDRMVEGRDYRLDRLIPFWRVTSKQDWALCERNHVGIRNPAFTPGPYSPRREYNVAEFDRWYLGRLTS
jgi:phenylpropionate dioxygenase-like ring-hydroxylating dioxygenase large terminal subunit